MKIISLPRAQGKTSSILKWMVEAPADELRVGIFFSEAAADVARLQARQRYGDRLKHEQFIGCRSDIRGRLCGRGREIVFAVDELDHVLSNLLLGGIGWPIVFGTITETP